jgi:hypothetical protein
MEKTKSNEEINEFEKIIERMIINTEISIVSKVSKENVEIVKSEFNLLVQQIVKKFDMFIDE